MNMLCKSPSKHREEIQNQQADSEEDQIGDKMIRNRRIQYELGPEPLNIR